MIEGADQLAEDMNAHAAGAWVVALDAVVETASGKVAFVARHSDGRNVAMMAPRRGMTHSELIAIAQAAFDSQHTGPIPG